MPEPVIKPITLEEPIKRGDTEITEIQIRKPKVGELRGVSLSQLMQMDVSELTKIMPRITQPTLTAEEIQNMDPADLIQVAIEVAYFLAPKALKTESLTA